MSEIWSVHVEARTDGTGLLDESAASRLLTLTQPHHGSVAAGGDPPRWAATVSPEAASATEAVGMATRIVVGLAAEAGLPAWPIVRAEAIREDVLDEDLASSQDAD